jgi:hypothetical protein
MVVKANQSLRGVAIKNTWTRGIPLMLQVVVGQPHGGGTQWSPRWTKWGNFFLLHHYPFYIA